MELGASFLKRNMRVRVLPWMLEISIFTDMDELIPPNTRPIPLQGNAYTFTESVRETAILAVSFAEDFERLLELYQVLDYDIFVRSKMFTLNHSSKRPEKPAEDLQGEEKKEEPEDKSDQTESFFFLTDSDP